MKVLVKRAQSVCLAVITITSLLLSGCAGNDGKSMGKTDAGEDIIRFKMAVADNDTTPYAKGAKKIAEEVEKATDGRIQIEVMAGGTLGAERDTMELAMLGSLDIVTCANSVLTNWIPEMSILDQAFLFSNEAQAHAAVDGKIGELINKEAAKLNLHVVGYMESGFRNVFSKKPIEKIEDFHGVTIRTKQNQYQMAAFESFGAMPTSMAAGDQFTALQQGTIDACENAVSNCLTNGFYEVTKDITYSNHAFVYILVCMSDHAWQQIPKDLQEPFLEGVRKGYEAERGYLKEANETAAAELKEKGVQFHEIDNAALQAAYKDAAAKKGFTFDSEWQAAVDEAIVQNP